ncbi:hypothetical protein [Aliikangiella coralliicola]|uniref:Uncharacterized protein n=1 Tax=Aliikangiella coralliicola TaxID=2592383 RepID=A0A545U8Z0_9GAMM|nr:hypothetical protein [Aliikangiella coralliicola]TQV85937.1 hypothetical protein FLL46_18640 [Aliikangiella coralliicola]
METDGSKSLREVEFEKAQTELKIKEIELEILKLPWYKKSATTILSSVVGALATGSVAMFVSFTNDLSQQPNDIKRQVIDNLNGESFSAKIPDASLDKYLVNYSLGYVNAVLSKNEGAEALDAAIATGERDKVLEVYSNVTAKMMDRVSNAIK